MSPEKKTKSRGRPRGSDPNGAPCRRATECVILECIDGKKSCEAARIVADHWNVAESTVRKDVQRHARQISPVIVEEMQYAFGKSLVGRLYAGFTEVVAASMKKNGFSDDDIMIVIGKIHDDQEARCRRDRVKLIQWGRIFPGNDVMRQALIELLLGLRSQTSLVGSSALH